MKHIPSFCLGLMLTAFALTLQAQRPMTVDDLQSWRRITSQKISNDGRWAACIFSPWKGDAEAQVYSTDGTQVAVYPFGAEVAFSAGSGYVVIKAAPAEAEVEAVKLRKSRKQAGGEGGEGGPEAGPGGPGGGQGTPPPPGMEGDAGSPVAPPGGGRGGRGGEKDEMPMDRLIIRNLTAGTEWTIDSLKSYRLAEGADWLAYISGKRDSSLHLTSLDGSLRFDLPSASSYAFAKESPTLYFVTKDSVGTSVPGLYLWTAQTSTPVLIKEGKGKFEQPTFSDDGSLLAFVYVEKSDKESTDGSLWISRQGSPAEQVLTRESVGMYADWIVSPNGRLRFSKDATRLFLGTAPMPRQKDTTQLAENRPNVQVWSWNEPVQYTVQSVNAKRDAKRSYTAVLHLADNSLVQLADTLLEQAQTTEDGVGNYALASNSRPYSVSSMWEGRTRSDHYVINLLTGERKELSHADYARYRLSPMGRFAYGYNETDSCWYTIEMASGQRHQLTTPATFPAWDEETDTPDYPRSYGSAGWTADDALLLIQDRYDLWAFSPTGETDPVRLTTDGRENLRRYSLVRLDREQHYVDTSETQLLTAYDETTKANSVYSANLAKPGKPKLLAGGDYNYGGLLKAKDAKRLLFTRENFETFPDLHSADLSMKSPVQLTHGISQQEAFVWGTAELISWTSLDGVPLQGVVYKPQDFDPGKKYPMIVNFYERNSETLYKYRMPEPHRSTVDYHLYLSNGYIIFNPDIRYSLDGFPGEDCYNCLMPGVAAVVAQGYVDEQHIGAQGHSWGGYQTAYLATRTNLFAAIESGAPVVNMFSAYGGIRWGSGMARSFQYEHTQSRIGGTPWDATSRYFENSPLFYMDKVHTPILIMHNDQDGHVPWYQGIEFFVAMKRLGHPAWLLNYTGEPHWPTKTPNKRDFQIRMFQFFNHFLKGEPAPRWMSEGLPAVDQPYDLGY